MLLAYLLQTQEMLFDAHNHAFALWVGCHRRGIYDNMSTGVDRVGPGKQREVNSRFAAMASHYLFETEFCNRAAGWEKGQVEKNVQDAPAYLARLTGVLQPRRSQPLAICALFGTMAADGTSGAA